MSTTQSNVTANKKAIRSAQVEDTKPQSVRRLTGWGFFLNGVGQYRVPNHSSIPPENFFKNPALPA